MSIRELAFCLISRYPHPLNRELEVPPVLCPKSLLLFAFPIIITMDFVRICGRDCNMCAYLRIIFPFHKLLKSETSRPSVSRFCTVRDTYRAQCE